MIMNFVLRAAVNPLRPELPKSYWIDASGAAASLANNDDFLRSRWYDACCNGEQSFIEIFSQVRCTGSCFANFPVRLLTSTSTSTI